MAYYFLAWNWAALICLVVGLLLMIYEMFTPGMGFPALFGALSLIAAIVLSADSLIHAMVTLALILIFLGVCAFFILRSLKKGRLSRSPIVLQESISGESTNLQDLQSLVGAQGVCLTALRPSGNADFNGNKFDVVSEGEFIEKGSRVCVERIEGLRIIVKRVEDGATVL